MSRERIGLSSSLAQAIHAAYTECNGWLWRRGVHRSCPDVRDLRTYTLIAKLDPLANCRCTCDRGLNALCNPRALRLSSLERVKVMQSDNTGIVSSCRAIAPN